MTVVLVGGESHHPVGVGRGLQGPQALHVRDVEYVESGLETHRHPLAVELDGQHGREEVDLADRVVLLRVPQTQPTRAIFCGCDIRFVSFRRGQGEGARGGGG